MSVMTGPSIFLHTPVSTTYCEIHPDECVVEGVDFYFPSGPRDLVRKVLIEGYQEVSILELGFRPDPRPGS